MTTRFPRYPNQGHRVSPGWDELSTLKNWTAYQGTDGVNFFPPSDRNGYTDGVDRRMGNGGVLMAGLPIVRLVFPWMSNGQMKYLYNTMLSGSESGNVTVSVHTPLSVTAADTLDFNAVMNLNLGQLVDLTRRSNGYELVEIELVLVEPL